jgi:hypothetical protein
VIVPLDFRGTIWEIQWLSSKHMFPKCVFVMPATMTGAKDYKEAWKNAMRALSEIGIDTPYYEPFGQLFVVENGAVRSLPSFVKSFLPRTTALMIQFMFLQCHRRKTSAAHGNTGSV